MPITSIEEGTRMANKASTRSYIPLGDVEFANWCKRFAAYVQQHAAELGVDAAKAAEMVSRETDFRSKHVAQRRAETALRGATLSKDTARSDAESLAREIAQSIRANADVPDQQLIDLNLNPRRKRSRFVKPFVPSGLQANPHARGYTDLKWSAGKNRTGTNYIVEAMHGFEGRWEFVGVTTKTSFRHSGQTPGVCLQYRVCAQRTKFRSLYSNTAIVYNPGGQSLRVAA